MKLEQAVQLEINETYGTLEQRRAAWRSAMRSMMDVAYYDDPLGTFTANLRGYQLGPLGIGELSGGPFEAIRTRETVERIGPGHFFVHAFTTAGFTGEIKGRRVAVADGDTMVFDQRGLMRLRFDYMRAVYLIVPRGLMLKKFGKLDDLDGLHLSAGQPQSNLLRGTFEAVLAAAPTMSGTFGDMIADSILEVCATCLQSSLPRGTSNLQRARSNGTTAKKRKHDTPLPLMMRFIDRNIFDPGLSPALLCKQFDVSRTTLYRMFKPSGGVHHHILSRRVAASQRWLAANESGRLSMSEIARRSGFSGVRTFRRVIEREYGITPRSLRREGATPAWSTDEVDASVSRFLDNLSPSGPDQAACRPDTPCGDPTESER